MTDRVITPADAEWPEKLNEMGAEAPVVQLFARGLPLDVGERTVAIVGARRPTAAGVDAAEMFARGLVEAGFTIVSGLAMGIDGIAHKAALDAGGYTVAVQGCGLDVDYPERNASLKRRISESGTILTEYPPGTPPNAFHFPERNRIIAAVAKGVLYVEGGERSGGRITARIGFELGRDVFAVPGSIRNPVAVGPNDVIRRNEAKLVTEVQHILEEIEPQLLWEPAVSSGLRVRPASVGPIERKVLDFLEESPVSPDSICARLSVKPGEAAVALTRLEVRGFVLRRRAGYELTSAGLRARLALALADSHAG